MTADVPGSPVGSGDDRGDRASATSVVAMGRFCTCTPWGSFSFWCSWPPPGPPSPASGGYPIRRGRRPPRRPQPRLNHVDNLAERAAVPETTVDRVRRGLTARLDHAPETPDNTTADAAHCQLRHEVIAVQNTELRRLYEEHRISDTALSVLQRDLDLEEAARGDT
ncbi:hypothetical protein AB0A71_36880 [Kitasatospora aureofaciens]|uniref:hypothetical protein n=1 Tax=Kitasatospora aureofaciens TaxID=1894 RepID=UPI0033F193D8